MNLSPAVSVFLMTKAGPRIGAGVVHHEVAGVVVLVGQVRLAVLATGVIGLVAMVLHESLNLRQLAVVVVMQEVGLRAWLHIDIRQCELPVGADANTSGLVVSRMGLRWGVHVRMDTGLSEARQLGAAWSWLWWVL